ncbi:F0F1 ATP synthase subunit epsilon [Pandoraea communis]|uniref:ATP synthase epsilon chain n=1 Tax=Pandoraea communis TaxID=2508297 RepID=A0A5E4UQU3_9BURK|nr:F0F1 ATP synthase subunit epsilon [Pandoraea communis]MDM8358069.1 F0F1 ATP synthase subunit epsilon [Pandoraea communis]VVE02348.1 F0F1 ATP synthase subunit epsilon [Pandoraea communis]
MTSEFHLSIVIPSAVLYESSHVVALRAIDASGAFGILPRHADFLTVLSTSVLRWRETDGVTHFCATGGAVLRMTGGHAVMIACREAVLGDSLDTLQAQVRKERAAALDETRRARVEQTRLHAQAVRQLIRYLHPALSGDALRGTS